MAFVYTDILLNSFFCYKLGGIDSDMYILFFFIVGYFGIINNISMIIVAGAICVIGYTASCIYSARMNPESLSYIRLAIKDVFLVLCTFGVIQINYEVRKYDELHRKEFKLARTDKLTGLANRHYFDQKIKEEVYYADSTKNPLNVLMFDLDNFKQFNDTYGHTLGDKLLVLFSDIIKQNIRKSDIPVRYGGEEFLILIRDLDIYIAKSVGERIRIQLEKQRIYLGNARDGKWVTVSCGIAQYPTHSRDVKEVIVCADRALYYAKERGRNCVVVYDEIKNDMLV